MNTTRTGLTRLTLAVALGGCTTLAGARSPAPFAGLTGLAPPEMAQLRGGLEVGGLKVDLTARLRTYIDDRLAAAEDYRISRLNDARERLDTRLADARARANEPRQSFPTTTSPGNTPADSATSTPDRPSSRNTGTGTGLAGEGGFRGTTAVSNKGSGTTTVTYDVSPQKLLSTITNTANDRRIHQQVDVEIRIDNFREHAARVRSARIAERFGRAVNSR